MTAKNHVAPVVVLAVGLLHPLLLGCGPDVYVQCEVAPGVGPDLARRMFHVWAPAKPSIGQKKDAAALERAMKARSLRVAPRTGSVEAGHAAAVLVRDTVSGSFQSTTVVPSFSRTEGDFGGIRYQESQTQWSSVPVTRYYSDRCLVLGVMDAQSRAELWRGGLFVDQSMYDRNPDWFVGALLGYIGRDFEGYIYSPGKEQEEKTLTVVGVVAGLLLVVILASAPSYDGY